MRAALVHRSEPVDLEQPAPPGHADCAQDLGLSVLISTAAAADPAIGPVVAWALAHPLTDRDAIAYRQAVLTDFLEHPDLLRELLATCTDALDAQRAVRHAYFWVSEHPDATLRRSVNMLNDLLPHLTRLRELAVEHADDVRSSGVRQLFADVRRDLDEARLDALAVDLRVLAFDDGVSADVGLGAGAGIAGYRLRRPRRRSRAERLSERMDRRRVVRASPTSDDGDHITALRDQALTGVATDLARATRHLVEFLEQLQIQLRLFAGAVALDRAVAALDLPRCFPEPQEPATHAADIRGLCNLDLALRGGRAVVGNDLVAEDRRAIVVTGANNGGKSTFLRSLGQAQLLMQAGFTVAASRFRTGVVQGVHTHFRRAEDETMTSGKLVEELERMSALVDRLHSGALVLFNESFATTYELEGTRIASTIVRALNEREVAVVYVTHMFELVRWFIDDVPGSQCLIAGRVDDGRRTYRIRPGEPERTSHALELYDAIVGRVGLEPTT